MDCECLAWFLLAFSKWAFGKVWTDLDARMMISDPWKQRDEPGVFLPFTTTVRPYKGRSTPRPSPDMTRASDKLQHRDIPDWQRFDPPRVDVVAGFDL